MSRAVRSFVWFVGLAVSVAGSNAGCAHLIENRAITDFAKSLEAHDLNGLKQASSDEFKQRALRTATSLEDLEILRLPDGKTSVVGVEEVSKDKKRVTVQVGQDKKEVFYELTREESGRWVVDDIYLKQKKKGIEAFKSVTEQMDLLLTVREFLDAWTGGERDQVLAVAAPKLRGSLEQLPPSYLAHLTRQVTQGRSSKDKFKPTASLDEKTAVVKLPRVTGETIVTLQLRKGNWRISDIAVAAKDEEEKLPSLLNLSMAVNQCVNFLEAYQNEDKKKLSEVCEKEFFDGSLSFADLKQAKLPEPLLPEHELQVRMRGTRADFVLRSEDEFVQIDMQRKPELEPDAPPVFVVSDVTIYEVATKQEKRLSALFTAQGMLEVFMDALSHRQIERVKHCSTQDFTSRVWSKLTEATVSEMPLDAFESSDVEYVSASFQGALTKIVIRQGGQPFTYFLRDEHGRFMVDDVEWQMTGVPASVKSTLEVMIPIQDFASGITLGRDPDLQEQALELIRGNTSNDFNKMVWAQTRFVPNSGMSADSFLRTPLRSMAFSEKQATVSLGDDRYGAKVTMRREHERFIVDDVLLIAGPQESERLSLRQSLRTSLAKGEARSPSSVIPASHEGTPSRRVEQAHFEETSDVDGGKTKAVNPPRQLDLSEPDGFPDP